MISERAYLSAAGGNAPRGRVPPIHRLPNGWKNPPRAIDLLPSEAFNAPSSQLLVQLRQEMMMKNAWGFIVFVMMVVAAPVSTFARLGETEAECLNRYGKSSTTYSLKN